MRIPEEIPLHTNASYCLKCLKIGVSRTISDGKTYYRCEACGAVLDRRLVIDDRIVWWLAEDRTYWHESVGVVVICEGKILCMMRQIFPFAFTIPAGHLDTGEEPEIAAGRELFEETGISVEYPLEHLGDFDISGDSCRRGSDDHRWHLYRYRLEVLPEIKLDDESSKSVWVNLDELRSLDPVTYPLSVIIGRYGADLF